jgi:hypothetical protein
MTFTRALTSVNRDTHTRTTDCLLLLFYPLSFSLLCRRRALGVRDVAFAGAQRHIRLFPVVRAGVRACVARKRVAEIRREVTIGER